MSPPYPVNLVLEGRRCLVVGGGPVAARKVGGLLECGADVTVIAPSLCDELSAVSASLSWERHPYRPTDLAGFCLVVVATDDVGANRAVAAEADAAGIWVNVADDPEACTFTLPAILRRGRLTVAVGTGGASPSMAGWARDRIAECVGEEYGALLDLVAAERRAWKAAGRSTEGPDWHSALDANMLELIRAGEIGKARERLQACLSSS